MALPLSCFLQSGLFSFKGDILAFVYICFYFISQLVQDNGGFSLAAPLNSCKHCSIVYKNKQSPQPGIRGLPHKNRCHQHSGTRSPLCCPGHATDPRATTTSGSSGILEMLRVFLLPCAELCSFSSLAFRPTKILPTYPPYKPSHMPLLCVPFLTLRDLICPFSAGFLILFPLPGTFFSGPLPPPSAHACLTTTYL